MSSPPLTTGIHGVEQADELPRHPRLGLTAFAEEDDVLAGEDRVLDGRDDRILVPDDAREERLSDRQTGDQVRAEFLLDRPRAPATLPQLTERPGLGRGCLR